MDILRRSLAPLSDGAWETISDQAGRCLKENLSARRIVSVDGPHGWKHAAVNLGRLKLQESAPVEGMCWGIREVLPLVEVRQPFVLSQMELDCIDRGCADPDLKALEMAAFKAASFEESCVYLGFESAGIRGMKGESPHEPIELPEDAGAYPERVVKGVALLQQSGVGGPYALVLGSEPYAKILSGERGGYPLHKRIEGILGGRIHRSPVFESNGILVASRGEDFELTVGQDFSVGYASHDRNTVELYLVETFTFRVLEPRASVEFRTV
jgi:uncharacterized linocin/CFP29 family protein